MATLATLSVGALVGQYFDLMDEHPRALRDVRRQRHTGRQQAALLADAYPPFVGKGDAWFVDSIHPNELGQEAVAGAFRLAYSNLAPVADAGPDQDVGTRATFDLDAGGSSDPESGPLTYLWEQVGGPAAIIESPRSARTRVTPANGTATLTFRVTVTDPIGATDTDEAVVKTK